MKSSRRSGFRSGGLVWPRTTLASDFDHSHRLFGRVLQQVVRKDLVDYSALKSDPKTLDEYLDQLAAVPESDFMAFSKRKNRVSHQPLQCRDVAVGDRALSCQEHQRHRQLAEGPVRSESGSVDGQIVQFR
jgi:hypothetical protein